MDKQTLQRSLQYIGSWLKLRHERGEIPGIQVAITHSGKLVFSQAYGVADIASGEPLTTDHIFRVASHSKMLTATALFQLAEQDKLRLDDPVVQHVPWLKQHKDKRFQKITIRQVASHGAGIIREGFNADFWQLEYPFPNAIAFKKTMLEADLVLENNLKMKYSNLGYALLGEIIESASGQPYREYIQAHIIEPIHLKHTTPDYSPALERSLAFGYGPRINKQRHAFAKAVDTRHLSSATGLCSTAADLCAFMSALVVGSGKLLSDESKKEMQHPQWTMTYHGEKWCYGLGLTFGYAKDHELIGHGGGFPGYVTRTWCDPEAGLAVSVLTNSVDGPAAQVATNIMNVLYEFQDGARSASKHDLTKFEGRYMFAFDTFDIIVLGDHLVCAQADTPFPLSEAEELEYIGSTTLKIKKSAPYISDAEGELVRFTFGKDGHVTSVVYAGYTLLPEKIYLQQTAAGE